MRLHIRTTLLTSVITIFVLTVSFFIRNSRVIELLHNEQKSLAEVQAIAFANQIGQILEPLNPQNLTQMMQLVINTRRGILALRVWERVGGTYIEVASVGNYPKQNIPGEVILALRNGLPSRTVQIKSDLQTNSMYRVFAPIVTEGRYSGAIELVEMLDNDSTLFVQYKQMAIWLSLASVVFTTLTTYFLFKQLVYRPTEKLLAAMTKVKEGELTTEISLTTRSEFGLIAEGFNEMVQRLHQMTTEREQYKQTLEERILEATNELKDKNNQLALANKEIWNTTRRLTVLEKLAAAGQTVAQFAHEVGTPLSLISGHVQLLGNHLKNNERALARLEIIGTQIERIERIVRSMLEQTRSNSTSFCSLSLNVILQKTLDVITPTLDTQNIKLVTSLQDNLPEIEGSIDRLQQAFINLFDNAIDAMPVGGTLSVSTRFLHKEGMIIVSISDTGCGIPFEIQSHVFDPLYTTKERGMGTGIGLFIVQQVVNEHHAKIKVSSILNAGTTFEIFFPFVGSDLL